MLNLKHLPKAAAETIVYVTGGKALPREIVEQIATRTDRVPPLVEEPDKDCFGEWRPQPNRSPLRRRGPVAALAIAAICTIHSSLDLIA
jgi:hypothetical protein